MDGPYRSAPRAQGAEAPRDRGIVGEVVAQFADPLAFYRELVQNAIDAGSATVEVEVRHDPVESIVRVTVRDRGEGMDRELIEQSLLVLFRSTKDKDPTKIGKFGIGFSSVLAPGPRVVVVDTVRDGRRLTVHLFPDLSYQLFEAGPATRTGTAVELELPIEPGAVRDFVERSRAALLRWCRHASVPIHFSARGAEGPPLADERIDRPLALDGAVVQVRGVSSDGAVTAVVGLLTGGATYSGFFNRGLMLEENAQPLAGAQVGFKVQGARLGHTLSRDAVRRDGAYEEAVAMVRWLVYRELRPAVARALAAAAPGDRPQWRLLFETIEAANLTLDESDWVVPLLAPIGEMRAIAANRLSRWNTWADVARSPLVDALADAGQPVVAVLSSGVSRRLAQEARVQLTDVHAELTLVTAVEPDAGERLMLAELKAVLGDVARAPVDILLADLYGAFGAAPMVSGGREHARIAIDDARWVIDRQTATENPFARLWRRALVLNAGDPVTQAARRRAIHDPSEAAAMLARAVLLHHRRLDVELSETLLTRSLARLGVRPGS